MCVKPTDFSAKSEFKKIGKTGSRFPPPLDSPLGSLFSLSVKSECSVVSFEFYDACPRFGRFAF